MKVDYEGVVLVTKWKYAGVYLMLLGAVILIYSVVWMNEFEHVRYIRYTAGFILFLGTILTPSYTTSGIGEEEGEKYEQ